VEISFDSFLCGILLLSARRHSGEEVLLRGERSYILSLMAASTVNVMAVDVVLGLVQIRCRIDRL